MKFAWRLILALWVGLCLILGVNGVERYRREAELLEGDMRRDHAVMGRGVAAAIGEVWSDEGRDRALDIVGRVNQREDRVVIRWVDPAASAGSLLDPIAPDDVVAPALRGEAVAWVDRSAAGTLVSYVPLRVDGEFVGAIELSESLEAERAFLRATLLRMLVTTGLLAVMSGGVALTLGVTFVGRPIRMLVERARRIGTGDFTTPLDLPQHDELGELAREMNTMASRLAAARSALEAEVAARTAADEQLRHAERLTTVGKLAAGVAHELGTPLNVITQRARLIATGEVVGDAVSDNARIIAEQSERITRIVRQLLDFARRRTLEARTEDLVPAVERVVVLLEPLARRSSVRLQLVPPDEAVLARFDPEQLQQVLTNLVVNAVQAMPEGGVVSLVVETRRGPGPEDRGRDHRWAVVEVTDHGVGIRPEELGRVFDPFFTTKRVGEGTGLGLSVAYGIVREHGGWIEVQSTPGEGSRFTVFLPAQEV